MSLTTVIYTVLCLIFGFLAFFSHFSKVALLKESSNIPAYLNQYFNPKTSLSKEDLGSKYELYVGYQYEKEGFQVTYLGLQKDQKKYHGIDLLATKGDVHHAIQCKYWNKRLTIYPSAINQLAGACADYNKQNKTAFKPVFITSTSLSSEAQKTAQSLSVSYRDNNKLIQPYPLLKGVTYEGRKLLLLPFDSLYTHPLCSPADFFMMSEKEAQALGYSRP